MAAAAVPAVVNNYALPAAVLDGLLKKYKFIPTRFIVEPETYIWQEKDPQFRYMPVICSGYSDRIDGIVYVNGEIISMLSEQPVLEFDCAKETFDTVMTFAHSMQRSNCTHTQLLELLPLVHQCKLPLLFDALALTIVESGGLPVREAFSVGLATESLFLVEYCFQFLASAGQLGHILSGSPDIFAARPLSAFLAEVSARISQLLVVLPPYIDAPEDPRRAAFHQTYHTIYQSMISKVNKFTPDVTKASLIWDVHLALDNNRSVFASREVLAHASRFFRHVFFSGFAATDQCLVPVEGVHPGDYTRLVVLLLPRFYGLLWRGTASAPATELEQRTRTHKCNVVYSNFFKSEPEALLCLLQLAEYFQITGLVDYLTDVAVHSLPWRERVRFADALKSREIMASLLIGQSLEEMRRSEDHLDDVSESTKDLIIEYFAHLYVF